MATRRNERRERRALREEDRAECKEKRLHNKASNQLQKGNINKAIRLECKANNAHHKAMAAGERADAIYYGAHNHTNHYHSLPPHCGRTVTVVYETHLPAPPPYATQQAQLYHH